MPDSRLLAAGCTVVLFLLGVLVAPPLSSDPDAPSPPVSAADSGAVAVVELFTSEGCSSCPPADRLLRSLVETARTNDRPIYALSFHVDYWNRLGWEDPYSKSAFSQRQRRYSHTLGVDTYTPQIVVNGQRAMVGSRAGDVQDAIETALAEPARVNLDLRAETSTDDCEVTYQLANGPPEDATLRLAVVERGLSQKVTRGENAGRTLRHANVVRTFESIALQAEGTVSLTVPNDVDRSRASIIGYVQGPSLDVIGAARTDLPGP